MFNLYNKENNIITFLSLHTVFNTWGLNVMA